MQRPTRRSGVIDAAAECDECDWSTTYRKNALANGALHAARTGHQVHFVQSIGGTYNPKDIPCRFRVV